MITVYARSKNTNAGGGFVIEKDGYPFEAGMGEAATVFHALRTQGQEAAHQAYSEIVMRRARGGKKQ